MELSKEKVLFKDGKVWLPSNRRDLWPSVVHNMSGNLFKWTMEISQEKPGNNGRPVPAAIYEEAIVWMQENDRNITLLSSKELMDKGISNTLFCGHYIYPHD